jgi:hypothetical protein
MDIGTEHTMRRGDFAPSDSSSIRATHSRVLGELVDVAVRSAKVHPGVAAGVDDRLQEDR